MHSNELAKVMLNCSKISQLFHLCLFTQEMEMRNSELERRIQNTEQNLSNSLEERDRMDTEIQRAIEILDIKIFDLNDLRQSLVKLLVK